LTTRSPPTSTLFPYTTLFRSQCQPRELPAADSELEQPPGQRDDEQRQRRIEQRRVDRRRVAHTPVAEQRESTGPDHAESEESGRSEEHTSELQSLRHLVCRLL